MSDYLECRTYSDPPWTVVVTCEREQPHVAQYFSVHCPWCHRSCAHHHYFVGVKANAAGETTPWIMLSTRVCDCTNKVWNLWNGKCPPWLTREEEVAWRLT